MDISIVIPVFNKSAMTRVCLEALERTLPADVSSETIVIDNHSTDETAAVLAGFPSLTVITNEKNLGFAAANNQGASVARGKYLLLLNNDTEPAPGWIHAMLRAASEPRVGVVGARLLFADGTLQHAGVVVGRERFGTYQFTPYHYLWSDPGERPAAMVRKDYQIVTGACLLTPRDLYLELGGLDELFWNGYEDVDYCFKVLERGLRVVYEPQAKVFHFESQSGPMRFSRHAYNSTLMSQRWADFPKIDHVQQYLLAGNIRRTNRVSNKFATVSMRAPKATVLIHGSPDGLAPDFVERVRNTAAPIEKILWTLPSAPPSFGGIPVDHRPADAIEVARKEMEIRGDRYLVFLEASTSLAPRWLDKLYEELEWGGDVVAATQAPELQKLREAPSLTADARCTVIALRLIPQAEMLGTFDTIHGALADLLLRLLSYELAVRGAAESAGEVGDLEPDRSFEMRHGAPLASFLRDDRPYIEALLANRSARPISDLKASIVMLSWNAEKFTKIALESIREHTKMAYEVIIVDNGSGDETTEWLREQEGIVVIYNPTNRGFAGGCNQGIAAATGDYIVLLNNDVVVTDGWLESLVEAVERDPGTGVSAPRSNEIAGAQKLLNLEYDSLEKMHAVARQRAIDHRRTGFFTDRAIGFCLCIRRSVIEQVGGIDESFGTGNFEDDDFSMRVRAAGYRIFVCNDVLIHHFGSVTFAANKIDYGSTMLRNWEIFAEKWGYGKEFPVTGYDPALAIRGGFDRGRHYVPVSVPPLGAHAADGADLADAAEGRVRLLIAAVVDNERHWNVVGNMVRRYLNAFDAADSVLFAIACTGDIDAETAGARVVRAIEKAAIDPEKSADVLVADESDAAAWFAGLGATNRFEIGGLGETKLAGFSELKAKSPSELRSLYEAGASTATYA